ncbi:MAG TPA: hypothetical protein VMS30_01885, partial [Phycisphaerales bacterium]|nr:hypothetical protein [Phycisphaerales bacterium]
MSVTSPLGPLHAAYAASLARAGDVALTVSVSRPGAATGRRAAGTPDIEMLPWGVAMPEVSPSISVGGAPAEPTPVCEIIASFGEVEA